MEPTSSDFVEQLRRSATSVGALVTLANGKPSLEQCGPAELSLLLSELHEAGYSIVNSRPHDASTNLGVMRNTGRIPEFFNVEMGRSSVNLPTTDGLFIAFLGPDGVGKTTTVDRVMARLKPIFGKQQLFHWRPQLIKPRTKDEELKDENGWTSINRHGDPPRVSCSR